MIDNYTRLKNIRLTSQESFLGNLQKTIKKYEENGELQQYLQYFANSHWTQYQNQVRGLLPQNLTEQEIYEIYLDKFDVGDNVLKALRTIVR